MRILYVISIVVLINNIQCNSTVKSLETLQKEKLQIGNQIKEAINQFKLELNETTSNNTNRRKSNKVKKEDKGLEDIRYWAANSILQDKILKNDKHFKNPDDRHRNRIDWHKKFKEWYNKTKAERENEETVVKLQMKKNKALFEKCPREGDGLKRPCCRKCCKRSYLGCL